MRLYYAIKMTIADHVYRFAEKNVTIDGEAFEEGLSPLTVSKSLDLETSITISILSETDWPTVAASNMFLVDGGEANIYLISVNAGTTSKELWFSGVVEESVWNDRFQQFSCKVKAKSVINRFIPHPLAQVHSSGNATWPISAATGYEVTLESIGRVYPIVIGYPGWFARTDTTHCVVPTYFAEYNDDTVGDGSNVQRGRFIVCDGYIDATRVDWTNLGAEDPSVYPGESTVKGSDLLGRPITTVFAITQRTFSAGDEILFGMTGPSSDTQYGGGLLFRGQVMRGASDIFQWLITRYTDMPLDIGRLEANRVALNQYKFDCWLNDNTDPVEWLTKSVLDFIPALFTRSESGFYLQPMPHSGTKIQSVLAIEEGRNAERFDPAKVINKDIYNEVAIDFGEVKGAYVSRIVITSQYSSLPNDIFNYTAYSRGTLIKDQICDTSQKRYGIRQKTIKLPTVWDESTAVMIGQNFILDNALPVRNLIYQMPLDYYWLQPGSVVTVTDSRLSISEHLCRVDDVVVNSQFVEVSVRPLKTQSQYL